MALLRNSLPILMLPTLREPIINLTKYDIECLEPFQILETLGWVTVSEFGPSKKYSTCELSDII